VADSLPSGQPARSWFDSPLRRRLLRRVLLPLPGLGLLSAAGGRVGALADDVLLWKGIRREVSGEEWRRLTGSSYVALYYHRLAGEGKPGQERLDLPPELFARQMALLRRLGFRALSPEQLIAFHERRLASLPARSFVVTADDGFLDCVEPFLSHAGVRPVLFVPSAEVGGRSWWAGDEPIAGWEDLIRLDAAGVTIGSHAHRHVALTDLDEPDLREQLMASSAELGSRLRVRPALLAYPHGRRDPRVTSAAAAAGFRLAFTTDPGRNGAGTDPMQLRRIGVKAWDSRLSFLWKVLTGELLPRRWDARLIRRGRSASPQHPPMPRPAGE
jgi:peptidoglycan/xylan/chitin deacetylase (PgdA/CDA1 family)